MHSCLRNQPAVQGSALQREGFTLLELLVVMAIIAILAAITLPALARAREAARRAACQSNLRQLAMILEMYANESQGEYLPATQKWHMNGTPTLMWLRGHELYPEYLTDTNLAICPSDSRAKEFIGTLGTDYEEFLKREIAEGASELCLEVLLSIGVSYTYVGYMTSSSSQLKDVVWSRVAIAQQESIDGNAVFVEASDLQVQGCPRLLFASYGSLGVVDIPGDPLFQAGFGQTDDDGSPMPAGYSRLRKGIERFSTEDVNSPSESMLATSEIPVIFDTWATNVEGIGGKLRFNHIPAGGNVLYLDGHVEFVRLGSRFPVAESPVGTYGSDLATVMAFVSGID